MKESTWRFSIGDVLPGDDPLARFVTVLGAALNDLLMANRLLLAPGTPTTEGERQYLLRTAIAHLWELSLTVSQWRDEPAVQPFVALLGSGPRDDLDAVLAIAAPGNDPVLKTIAHLRNATWHYAGPKNKKWIEKALRGAADHEGILRFGTTVGTIRADFADEIILQFSVQQFPGDDEGHLAAIRQLYERVTNLMRAAIRLLQGVLMAFFEDRKDLIDFGSPPA